MLRGMAAAGTQCHFCPCPGHPAWSKGDSGSTHNRRQRELCAEGLRGLNTQQGLCCVSALGFTHTQVPRVPLLWKCEEGLLLTQRGLQWEAPERVPPMEKLRSAVVKTVSEQPEPCSQFLAPWKSESGPLTPPAMPTKAVADFQSRHHHREGVRPTKHAPENGPKPPVRHFDHGLIQVALQEHRSLQSVENCQAGYTVGMEEKPLLFPWSQKLGTPCLRAQRLPLVTGGVAQTKIPIRFNSFIGVRLSCNQLHIFFNVSILLLVLFNFLSSP